MVRFTFSAVLLFIMTDQITAQNSDDTDNTKYALEFSQFVTGSGFKTGTEAYITIIPDTRKQVSLGIYFCSEYKKITGISVHHERTLVKIHPGNEPFIIPYAFYDFIYRKNTIREVLEDKSRKGELVTYASMEHHLGIGGRIKITPSLDLKTEAGYGVYLGSIKKPSEPDKITGEISGTNGFGVIAKIGFCYTF
jgi:hypothetical protein